MIIQFETSDANHEIAEYILRSQNGPGSFCHLCPTDKDGIIKELERLFAKSDPRVLVIRDDFGVLQGVYEKRGSRNFVKERKAYRFDKERYEAVRQRITQYVKE